MSDQDNIGHRPALQAATIATFGECLHAAQFHLGAASAALGLGDCPAAVEALDKGRAAMADAENAYARLIIELAALLQAAEGGDHE